MPHRYYSAEPIAADRVTLDGAEAHHLLHVLRASPGVRVVLFDGSGREFDAEVAACGRTSIELTVIGGCEVDRELPFPLVLGVPLPKGDRSRWIVEKAVELGVTRLVPLHTARSTAASEQPGEKLGRYVIEGSKQCGRNRLMGIATPQSWAEWLAAPAESRRVIADPTGRPLATGDWDEARSTFAAVGPEGGLTDDELADARAAGWDIVSLGPRILRIETAAVVIASQLSVVSGP